MIDLLPEQAKQHLVRERFSRFLLLVGAATLAVLISVALLMTLTLLSLNWQKSEFSRELESAKKSPTLERVEEVEEDIAETNDKIKAFLKNSQQENRVTNVLKAVLVSRTPLTKIHELTYNGPLEFQLSGSVGTRDDLLAFIRELNVSDLIDEVNSPISNLLKDRNIEFFLSFTTTPEIISENPERSP